MYELLFTVESIEDISILRKPDQRLVLDALQVQLSHQPAVETRAGGRDA